MRVLVIGGNGMLGRDVVAAFRHGHDTIWADRSVGNLTVDITERDSVGAALRTASADVVINCAAYTNVDAAEHERDEAYRVNAWGTWNLAAACADRGVPLMHVSTDFVFDGEKGSAYGEFDTTNPVNAYGASKLAGEQSMRCVTNRFWLVRTQWLFGRHGRCFPAKMVELAGEGREIRVVNDQFGSPSYSVDVAATMRTIVEDCPHGVYHVNNAGECSWYDFAQAIVERAGFATDAVRPVSTPEYVTAARRPVRSTLRRLSLEAQGKDTARPWQEALKDYIATL